MFTMRVGSREFDICSPFSRFTTAQLCGRLLQDPTCDVSLHAAAREADLNKLTELLQQHVKLDGADSEGQTALHFALRSGSLEIVCALLEAGASPDPPCLPPTSAADVLFILFRLVKIFIYYSVVAWITSKLGIHGLSGVDRYLGRLLSVELVAMLLFYILSRVTMVRGLSIGEAATSFRGDSEFMVIILLDSGFRPRCRDMSLLWIDAVRKGHTGVCRRLMEMGWDIDTRFQDLSSPKDPELITTGLLYACAASHRDLVLLFLSAGADPTLVDSWGRSCLLLALTGENDEEPSSTILKVLLSTGAADYLNVNHFPDDEFSGMSVSRPAWGWPLGLACQRRRVRAVKALLEVGAEPNLQAASGVTALHVACDYYFDIGLVEMVEMLLEHGADANAVTADSWTAVGYLCKTGISPEALALLVAAGARVEFGAGQNTPLQITARYDVSGGRLVELLLQHGANVNATGGKFGNALLAALHRPANEDSQPDVLKVVSDLIRHGADVNFIPDGCFPPIVKAATQNWTQVVELLVENGAVIPPTKEVPLGHDYSTFRRSVLHVPALGYLDPYQSDVFHLLLRHGASPNGDTDFNMSRHRGKTILGYACSFFDLNCVHTARLLLDSGADPNGVDARGRTPMLYATYALSMEHVRMLLKHGAYPLAQEAQEGTPWHSLCKGMAKKRRHQAEEIFHEICGLVEDKWSVNSIWTRDESGKNCLHYLVELGEETHLVRGPGASMSVRRSPAVGLIETFLSRYSTTANADALLDEDNDGHTAFQIAATTGDMVVMAALVEHVFRMECDVAAVVSQPQDPSMPFIPRNLVLTPKLLAHADHEGRTALHMAALNGRISACRFLAENPYRPGTAILTKSGQSPADCAESNEHYVLAEYLLTFKSSEITSEDIARRKVAFLKAHRDKISNSISEELVNAALASFDKKAYD